MFVSANQVHGNVFSDRLYKSTVNNQFFLLQVKALGCDGSTSLSSWLENLGLHEYLQNFLASGYRSLDCVKNLWELEIVNVSHADAQGRPGVSEGEISFIGSQGKGTNLTGHFGEL